MTGSSEEGGVTVQDVKRKKRNDPANKRFMLIIRDGAIVEKLPYKRITRE
jgi:hypothetical protein